MKFRREQNPFINLVKLEKLKKIWAEVTINEFISYLEQNTFTEHIETVYMDANEFLKRNEDQYFIQTLNLLLLWEFILKIKVNDAYQPTNYQPSDSEEQQELTDKLVFNMACVNNFRITLVDNITNWIINRFEYANEQFPRYQKLSETEIKKVKSLASNFKKMYKKYFSLKEEAQSSTFEDISYTIDKAIEIGQTLFDKTEKGKKFERM
ncbi:MAG: hypothetical protein ACW967_08585 [Candidatus Hodarchaeales archaeon]|jgi:hypothetical protein